jgi:hypothetical protein
MFGIRHTMMPDTEKHFRPAINAGGHQVVESCSDRPVGEAYRGGVYSFTSSLRRLD